MSVPTRVERIYEQFARYPCPDDLWMCEQCGPEWSAEDVRATPLRSISLPQLVTVHVMTLGDDALRYFFPRLMDLMLTTHAPVFDFRLSDLADRLPRWQPAELDVVRQLAEAVWQDLLHEYPCALGYFSDCPSALDFITWCDLEPVAHLNLLTATETVAAARHLAVLIDSVFTMRDPFESASKTTVLGWMQDPAIGECLQAAFFAADSDEAAAHLSSAHELWTVCATGS